MGGKNANPREHREMFAGFIGEARGSRVAVLTDADADGLASAALLVRALPASGLEVLPPTAPHRAEFPPGRRTARALTAQKPDRLIVLDLGAHRELVPGVPTLYVNHHEQFLRREGETVLAASETPGYSTGVHLHELLGSVADVEGLGWLAAVSSSHVREGAGVGRVEKRLVAGHHKSDVRRLGVQLNAASRVPQYDWPLGLRLLLEAESMESLPERFPEEMALLEDYREQVAAERARVGHAAPRFMWRVALVAFRSRFLIGDILAAQWARRLDQYIVVAANSGLADGRVVFNFRTRVPLNLFHFLDSVSGKSAALLLADGYADNLRGNVSGGAWTRILRGMKFRDPENLIP